MKKIITDKEKLSERAEEINTRNENALMRETVLELKKIIREKNLLGLTAPQIGVNKRILCINFNGDIRSFINPVLSSAKGLTLNREKCSSIPNKEYIRPRNTEVIVMYETPLGKIESKKILGKAAMVFQHEIDHLDGLLLSDVGLEIDKDWDKATEDERAEVIRAYMDSLDLKEKQLKEEIESNEELKKMNDAVKFIKKVQNGEVKLDGTVSAKKEDKQGE